MADTTTLLGAPTLRIVPLETLLKQDEEKANELMPEPIPPVEYDNLTGYVIEQFEINKRAKEESGIEDEIRESLEAFNGEYSLKDRARIADEGGSEIFMNITATKARAAKSWIADILIPPKGQSWSIEPTPLEDLPEDISKMIRLAIQQEFLQKAQQSQSQPQPPQQGQPSQQGQPPQQGMTADQAQQTLVELNRKMRDVEDAIAEEITVQAKHSLKKMQRKIEDQLVEGNWDTALLIFIDDFVVYPTAFMKGPVIVMGKELSWEGGKPVEKETLLYKNERVDPYDIYPSPSATKITDGNLIEHMRLSRASLESLMGVKGYNDENIKEILKDFDENGVAGSWLATDIEQEKASLEMRGSSQDIERGIIHALHFFGRIPVTRLQEWEYMAIPEDVDEEESLEVEAIVAGNKCIKCIINDDPLLRRPYYKASFINRPGSFWGRSLPKVMESQQRMCNAVARALSNNLAMASGPQIALTIDRLADDGAIDAVVPMRIWQTKSDPTGAGGKAIDFFQPTSNAEELLKVYTEFEMKADDVTGIPRYAYGNEKTAGAAQTAQGLAMLLESTSKVIKDCIRNIDEGLIKPRIQYQFYANMIQNAIPYTGDIKVKTLGSSTLSLRGAEATRRNEFLVATANPTDMGVMGVEGRAAILRVMAEDLGINPNVIPSGLEVKKKLEDQTKQQMQMMMEEQKTKQAKVQAGIQATQIQTQGQMQMHQTSMEMEMNKLKAKMESDQRAYEAKVADIQRKYYADVAVNKSKQQEIENNAQDARNKVAVKLAENKTKGTKNVGA